MTATTDAPVARTRPKPFVALVMIIARLAPGVKPRLQKGLIRVGYQVLNRRRIGDAAVCLNYGYAPPPDSPWRPSADLADRSDRFGLQLYERVAGAVPLTGADVLEVGCGRGGGAAHVAATFGPRRLVGVDFSARAIDWCRRLHSCDRLEFRRADAEQLPFGSASFDAVINVESSHCYPNVAGFLDEVHRVLRPGGTLLLADLRPTDQVDGFRAALAARFTVELEEEITDDVVRALRADADRRTAVIDTDVASFLRPAVRDFFAVPGSEVFAHLEAHRLRYLRFVLRR